MKLKWLFLGILVVFFAAGNVYGSDYSTDDCMFTGGSVSHAEPGVSQGTNYTSYDGHHHTVNDDLLYYCVGTALGGAGGGYLPAAAAGSAGRTTSTFFNSIVMPKAQNKARKKASMEAEKGFKPRAVTPAFRYEYVDLENIGDGDLSGMTAGFDWAFNNTTVGILVPYDYMDYNFITGNRIGSIIYGRYDYHVSNQLTVGASTNFNYMHTYLNSDNMDDVNLYGGGLGVTATYDAGTFVPSVAFAYQYSEDDTDMNDDHQHLIKMGLNCGYRLGDSFVLNAYGIWNYDITDYSMDADNDYFDLGGEISYNITETWGFNAGYKRILDLTDYSSDQVYIGTLWRF